VLSSEECLEVKERRSTMPGVSAQIKIHNNVNTGTNADGCLSRTNVSLQCSPI
jgi:hypothetical protein